ncbi:MAG: penicillin-binding protein 2 [bacterium]
MLTNEESIRKHIIIVGYIIIAVFTIFTIRLWQLQVLSGKKYYAMSEDNRLKVLKVSAPRGIIYDRNGKALVKNMPFYSASLIPGSVSKLNTAALAGLLALDEDEVEDRIAEEVASFETIKLKEGIPFEEVAYIEARRSDFPGLIIEPEIIRQYVYGSVASHVVGYLGMQGPEKVESSRDNEIPHDAFIGKWGVEALYDEKLRGKPGRKYIEVDALGRQLRIVREDQPQKGDDLVISLDIEVQKKIEEAYQGRSGAAVALNPKTGEILALVSLPSFDPNLFSRGISPEDWKMLNEHPAHPFLNRAIQSQFPPGSTFKTVVLTAALQENVLPPNFKVSCYGKIHSGNWDFRCWRREGHGVVDIHRGLVESCDVFFYTVGNLLGIDRIAEYAGKLGLGKTTGIEFPDEKPGFIPTTQWKEKARKQPWYTGETYHSSIGQGYVLTTPIQLAELIASVSMNGTRYKPKITLGKDDAVVLGTVELKPETLQVVKEALRGVVNEAHGTAAGSRSKAYIISGKTGTAQVVREKAGSRNDERFRDHAWFTAYAPYENPEIAVSVFVEHGGHGSSAAAPIAKVAIEQYLTSINATADIDQLPKVNYPVFEKKPVTGEVNWGESPMGAVPGGTPLPSGESADQQEEEGD